MNFDEFQNLARLYVVGALDAEDIDSFKQARADLGAKGEDFIRECRKLNSMFALSLRPQAPRSETREKLLERIRATMQQGNN